MRIIATFSTIVLALEEENGPQELSPPTARSQKNHPERPYSKWTSFILIQALALRNPIIGPADLAKALDSTDLSPLVKLLGPSFRPGRPAAVPTPMVRAYVFSRYAGL